MGDLRHVETWVFDLDNTLYPADCGLFRQIDRKMTEFISRLLSLPPDEARRIQKQYYREYGTTLSGLMRRHSVDPHEFMDYVHDIDASEVDANPDLGAEIERLPGKRYIMTNGSVAHAENVLTQLGLTQHFNDIFDIAAAEFLPKPHRATYEAFIGRFGFEARAAAMFEDLPQNLQAPHALGMTTILLRGSVEWGPEDRSHDEHDHVHHTIDDLTGFLRIAQIREREPEQRRR